jgi:hypothetical protein
VKTIQQIADLTPDPHNANKGSKRGLELLEPSLERLGAGRSIVADRNGVVIAGNKTLEQAGEMGLDVVVVRTDGHRLVVVQRMDLDMASADDPRARELAIADNRVSEVDMTWDPEVLLNHVPGVELGGYFFDEELARMWGEADAKGELTTANTQTPPAAAAPEPTVEPDQEQAAAHDPADEDQTICPECGHTF